MISSTTNTAIVNNLNVQSAYVRSANIIARRGCKVNVGNITQNMSASQTVKVALDLSSTQNLQEQISNALKSNVANSSTQKQGFLSTASTASNNYTNINDYIENLTETTITNTVTQELRNLMESIQIGDSSVANIICEDDSEITSNNISQYMVSKQIVDTLVSALMSTVTNASRGTDVQQLGSINANQENNGLTGIINSIIKLVGGVGMGFGLIYMCPCITLICCLFLCCGGMKYSGGGSGSTAFGKILKKF